MGNALLCTFHVVRDTIARRAVTVYFGTFTTYSVVSHAVWYVCITFGNISHVVVHVVTEHLCTFRVIRATITLRVVLILFSIS